MRRIEQHIDAVHGTYKEYSKHVSNRLGLAPYVTSPTEKRMLVQKMSICEQYATVSPENEQYQQRPVDTEMRKNFW